MRLIWLSNPPNVEAHPTQLARVSEGKVSGLVFIHTRYVHDILTSQTSNSANCIAFFYELTVALSGAFV